MSLFQLGDFTLASGQATNWKIECDALTDDDWQALAFLISRQHSFGNVIGVPRGGLKLAGYLWRYVSPNARSCLIVDDVYTTGGSMHKLRDTLPPDRYFGAVVFARAPIPRKHNWIKPLFQMKV